MKTETKRTLFIALAFITGLAGLARADLAKRIDAIIKQPSQRDVQFSIHIVKADSGETVYSHNADRAVVPASNMKIVITAAALKYLGADYEYKTKVGLCGDALVIIGAGDPLLGDRATDAKYDRKVGWIFEDIITRLKKNGITAIKDIIVDSSVFDDERVHPNWPKKELNRWYACEVSGLNFNGNCIEIVAKNVGGRVAVFVEPETSFIKVINKVKPIRKGKSAVGSYRTREPNKIIVFGKCKKQEGPFSVAIERPAAFFSFLLAEKLAEAGISVKGRHIEKALEKDCDFRLLAEYSSSLADCLTRCHKDSFGLAAEALLKTIAAGSKPGGKNGGWIEGQKAISQYLSDVGVEKKEFYIDDGSGLSKQNKLSANAITKVLLDVYRSKNWGLYRESLAAGGVDGTIRKYFKEEKYRGKIFGKTGYINNVKSFSGICDTGRGDYIFSILANEVNSLTRPAINNIAKVIIDDADI